MDAMTVAIDLAKHVFQIAVPGGDGTLRQRRRLSRRQFSAFVETLDAHSTVVMEACGTAHYWARRCQARGATVRLLPAQYVRAYVRRNKTDRTDTEALLEADRCRGIHSVPVKSVDQQALQGMHRVRQQWQRTRTARINLARALLREQGIDVPAGAHLVRRRIATLLSDETVAVPSALRPLITDLLEELQTLNERVDRIDAQLQAVARAHPVASRLLQIPGIGVITASALIGSVPHIGAFRRSRHFASWLGLTPRESSSGLRRTLGAISKQGDRYLRTLLIHGARSALRAAERAGRQGRLTRLQQWALATSERRGRNRAAVALANKVARVIWAVWLRDEDFRAQPAA